MLIALAAFGLVLLLIGAAALVLFFGYRTGDLLVLGFLATVAFYLSRLDTMVWTNILGRYYLGFHWYLLAVAVGLVLFRAIVRYRPSLGYAPVFVLLAAFSFLALISGLFNGALTGFSAAVHVVVITLAPVMVAALCVDLTPRTEAASRRLRTTFILLVGVVTPLIVLTSALAPNLYGGLLGWSVITAERGAGFVRGWSPLGSPVSSGIIMVLAYGLAMHEFAGNRKRIYLVILLLILASTLFTLTRSVLLMLLLFHVIYFWSAIRRHPAAVLSFLVITCLVSIPAIWKLQERFSFERLLLARGSSLDLRTSSALGAATMSFESPFLGKGPGLLYEELRLGWPTRPDGVVSRETTMLVGNRLSAMEPHNLYLFLAAEHGWIAAAMFCTVLWLLWNRVRISRFLSFDTGRSISAAFSALWLSTFAVLLTSSIPLVNPQCSVFFWFFGFMGLHWRTVALQTQASRCAEPASASTLLRGPHGQLTAGQQDAIGSPGFRR